MSEMVFLISRGLGQVRCCSWFVVHGLSLVVLRSIPTDLRCVMGHGSWFEFMVGGLAVVLVASLYLVAFELQTVVCSLHFCGHDPLQSKDIRSWSNVVMVNQPESNRDSNMVDHDFETITTTSGTPQISPPNLLSPLKILLSLQIHHIHLPTCHSFLPFELYLPCFCLRITRQLFLLTFVALLQLSEYLLEMSSSSNFSFANFEQFQVFQEFVRHQNQGTSQGSSQHAVHRFY